MIDESRKILIELQAAQDQITTKVKHILNDACKKEGLDPAQTAIAIHLQIVKQMASKWVPISQTQMQTIYSFAVMASTQVTIDMITRYLDEREGTNTRDDA